MFQQNKMATMGEMLENITHQWKQPLSAISIISSGTLMQRELGIPFDEEVEAKNLNNVILNVEHLSQTIDDFKDFFKSKNKTLFSLNKMVIKCINVNSNNIKRHNITIHNNVSNQDIKGYENQLIQVMMNIINNSIDAVEDKDTKLIIIDSEIIDNKYIQISIKDSGGGISEEIIHKVFNSHFTTKETGTGIGLYMSKRIIVEQFNGILDAKNTNFEINGHIVEGAKFTIKLPLSLKN